MSYSTKQQCIVVMGRAGTGKSTLIQHMMGRPASQDDESLEGSKEVQEFPAYIDGQHFLFIEIPDCDSDGSAERKTKRYLQARYNQGSEFLGAIYMHRISDNRVDGTTRKSFISFRKLWGENAMSSAIIATSMWDRVIADIAERREYELRTEDWGFKAAVVAGATMERHDGTTESARLLLQNLLRMRSVIPECVAETEKPPLSQFGNSTEALPNPSSLVRVIPSLYPNESDSRGRKSEVKIRSQPTTGHRKWLCGLPCLRGAANYDQ